MILLLVEDEDIIRRGFLVTIQKLELRFDLILEARDGEEGLRLFENYHPDIVITDIRMPLMDGLTFIQKSREISHESRFIVLSGYNDFEYARTALRYEVRDYLLKPSSKAEICDVLLRVMEEIQKAETESSALKERLDDYDLRLNQFHQLLLGDILLGKYADAEIAPLLSHHAISLPEQGEGFMICRGLEALYGFLLSSLMQYRNAVTGKRNTAAIESVHSPIDRAIAYIDQNYYKELDLALLSQLVSMNSSYFSSQFKKKTGLSFSTYLQNVRLEKAKNMLLHSDQKLHEISAAIGIGNVKYFCRLFKNYTGVTPTEYKRQFQISDS